MIEKRFRAFIGAPKGVPDVVRVSQYDSAWKLIATIYNGDTPLFVPDDWSAIFTARKSDGTISTASAVPVDGNVEVVLPESATAAAGRAACEIQLSDGSGIVGTALFALIAEENPASRYRLPQDDFDALNGMINTALDSKAYLERIASGTETRLDAQDVEIAQIRAQASSPFDFARTAADLSDTTRCYVWVRPTATVDGVTFERGAWYYHDDTAWVKGGMYTTSIEDATQGVAAESISVRDAVSVYFDPTEFSDQSQFSLEEMPANSHTYTYARKFSDAPDGTDEGDLLYIQSNIASQLGNVRFILCSDMTSKAMFYARKINGSAVNWTKIATEESVEDARRLAEALKSAATIDLMDEEFGLATKVRKQINGITFDWEGKECKVSGSATGMAFTNVLVYNDGLPPEITPGSMLRIKTDGLHEGQVILRVYLYPNTLPNRNIEVSSKNAIIYVPYECTGVLARIEVPNGADFGDGARVSVHIYNGPTKEDISTNYDEDCVKILAFGSSFTFSTLGLFPLILQKIAPQKKVVLGICYQPGARIQTHIDNWESNAAYPIFAEFNGDTGRWMNLDNSVSGKNAVDRRAWDFVVLQQASRYSFGDENYAAMETLADLIASRISNPISFLYNLIQPLNDGATYPSRYTQPTGKERQAAMFTEMAEYAQRAAADCVVSAVLPCGTAVQNARTTTLDAFGERGDMAVDNSGHLQNGIATYVPALAAAYKMAQIIGIKPKIFGVDIQLSDAMLDDINLQTRISHGQCVGISAKNLRIAAKCALAAIKSPFEITDMSGHEEATA